MAYGLRLISNNRSPATDGRDWIIDGDQAFRHGKATGLIPQHGRTGMEVTRARAAAKEHKKAVFALVGTAAATASGSTSASSSSGILPPGPLSHSDGLDADGKQARRSQSLARLKRGEGPSPAVLNRWHKTHSMPDCRLFMDPNKQFLLKQQMGEGSAAKIAAQKSKENFRSTALEGMSALPPRRDLKPMPISKYHNHSEFIMQKVRPAAGDEVQEVPPTMNPGPTGYSDLYKMHNPSLPPAPYHDWLSHSEDIQHRWEYKPEHLHKELPRGADISCPPSVTGKYHWFGDSVITESCYFDHQTSEDGLSKAKVTFRPRPFA